MTELEQVDASDLRYCTFSNNDELEIMIKMIEAELSEPYSIFTYRYFLQNWPNLCFLVNIHPKK